MMRTRCVLKISFARGLFARGIISAHSFGSISISTIRIHRSCNSFEQFIHIWKPSSCHIGNPDEPLGRGRQSLVRWHTCMTPHSLLIRPRLLDRLEYHRGTLTGVRQACYLYKNSALTASVCLGYNMHCRQIIPKPGAFSFSLNREVSVHRFQQLQAIPRGALPKSTKRVRILDRGFVPMLTLSRIFAKLQKSRKCRPTLKIGESRVNKQVWFLSRMVS